MFGSNLKKMREQKGLSQGDISKELYVVRQTVSKWENGLSSPSAEQLIRVSKFLEGLMGWVEKMNEVGVALGRRRRRLPRGEGACVGR